jgi:hypothetical protein
MNAFDAVSVVRRSTPSGLQRATMHEAYAVGGGSRGALTHHRLLPEHRVHPLKICVTRVLIR